jgi:hypothetical protein
MAKTKQLVQEMIPPKIVKTTEDLMCDLNPVEWTNRASSLADANRQVDFLEDRKKSVVADMNSDIKVAKLHAAKLTNVVANHRELREVTVEVKYDYELGLVTKTRTDTKEVVSSREMTTEERQSELELVDANNFIESRHETPADEGESDGVPQDADASEAPSEESKNEI